MAFDQRYSGSIGAPLCRHLRAGQWQMCTIAVGQHVIWQHVLMTHYSCRVNCIATCTWSLSSFEGQSRFFVSQTQTIKEIALLQPCPVVHSVLLGCLAYMLWSEQGVGNCMQPSLYLLLCQQNAVGVLQSMETVSDSRVFSLYEASGQ